MKGVKTVSQATHWLRNRWGQQALILGYHRVTHLNYDPHGGVIRPSHFAEQMAVLRRVAHPISLTQAYQGLQTETLPRRAVVVTFDGGYTDIMSQAWPSLADYEIPATTFVIVGWLGKELWWDELARLILTPAVLPTYLQLNVNGRLLTWSAVDPQPDMLQKQSPTARYRLLQLLCRAIWAQQDIFPAVLAELRSWSSATTINHDHEESGRVMSAQQMATLTKGGLMEIGSHTIRHIALDTLPAAAQAIEIGQSKTILEEITGQPVVSLSYPCGLATAVTQQLAKEAGYRVACASQNGLARQNSNPYFLPRIWPQDWDGETFARWLRRWLPG